MELGIGPEFAHHHALDFILQDLGQFPTVGWTLIKAGLRSRVIRNRNFALRALGAWGRDSWSAEILDALHSARENEPDDRVRKNVENALTGTSLE
ncbi:hypothetical protein [Rhizobium rhizogenes]|uniref:hypothetical protein n=1 Tax=Rhizobium rhizogenes TaxID=359 RepID=UPI001571DAD0|nr:hypothetical protein [Rhizobium rhizogenes]NTF97840.1 hypothetical protein [Rhizobium rhizogenes]